MTEVDDIQSFIAAQKRRIEEERAGLSQPSVGHRDVSEISHSLLYGVILNWLCYIPYFIRFTVVICV